MLGYPDAVTRGRLLYRHGNEHNPCNPFGRVELTIELDGTARLEHFARGGVHRQWTGSAEAAALEQLWSSLEQAGFPQTPPPALLPPDSTLRTLLTESGGTEQSVRIEWHAAAKLPGYAEAFEVLDAIVREVSDGTIDI